MEKMYREKLLRQLELEREMEGLGFEKAMMQNEYRVNKGLESASPYGKALLSSGIAPLAEAVEAFLREDNCKTGRKHTAAKLLAILKNPQKAAFLSLRQILNLISTPQTLAKAAVSIGNVLEKEARLIKFKNDAPQTYKNICRFVTTLNEAHRYASFRVAMNKSDISWEKWSLNQRIQLGTKMIGLIESSTGYITLSAVKDKISGVKVNMVVPSEKCAKLMEKIRKSALMTPEHLPMIIPPKNWTNPFDGGYYSCFESMPLVKARFDKENYLNELDRDKESMQTLYTAVNAIQSTAYRINKRVYSVLQAMWTQGGGGILPEKEGRQKPACTICGETPAEHGKHHCFTFAENKEVFSNWKRLSEETFSYNAKLFGKQIQIIKILYLADKFKDEENIYFPVQLDFRGRVYPVSAYLHPQGSDYAKGLLEFAEGKALEDFEGVKWLAIHGANLFGEDKISFENRLLWVLENEDKILACAKEPLKEIWWHQAAKPFQFLAFCFEWADYVECCSQERPFISHIPTAMDGTCNGLQIFSLLMRDEEGGKATNLVKSSVPMDIYGIVASKVKSELELKAKEGLVRFKKNSDTVLYDEKELARLLLDLGIDRYATKRQVMTLPYGSTFSSCREYTYDWLANKKETASHKLLFEKFKNLNTVSLFLSELIWQAINDTVHGAKTAMEYLRKVAQVLALSNAPIRWTTPIGFKVVQAYPSMQGRRVKCELGANAVFVSIKEEYSKIDARFQKNGISPNFIHSLDGAAMMKTVEIALSKGVSAFAMVHDSYACHAADGVALSVSLREAFRELFKEDLLSRFGNEAAQAAADYLIKKFPAQPSKGALDIESLMESDYFFG